MYLTKNIPPKTSYYYKVEGMHCQQFNYSIKCMVINNTKRQKQRFVNENNKKTEGTGKSYFMISYWK